MAIARDTSARAAAYRQVRHYPPAWVVFRVAFRCKGIHHMSDVICMDYCFPSHLKKKRKEKDFISRVGRICDVKRQPINPLLFSFVSSY